MVVDHEDLLDPKHSGAGRAQQTHWAGAVDRQAGALTDRRIVYRLERGRQDVGKKQHLLVRERTRHLEWPGIGLGHPHVFRLPARNAAIQVAETEQGGSRWDGFLVENGAAPGVGGLTRGELIQLAEEATATGDHKRNHHAVPGLHGGHARTCFLDDTHELVAEDIAVFRLRDLASIQMQIGTADRRSSDPQNDVVVVLDDGIGNVVDLDAVGAVVSECSHGRSLS
ncbi:hypothetical protein D3C73_1095380 [compost metagenome]